MEAIMKREITRADIIPMDEYGKNRAERRRAMTQIKRDRRVEIGPYATFYFENYDTMWNQVHEMLYIEKGGEEQIAGELEAYNPLIPKGRELVATLMFEIDNPTQRAHFLGNLGGVEETVTLEFAGETIHGEAEEDVDRTTEEGKASSVQFIHFPFTDAQAAKFKQPNARATVAINHEAYGHSAVIPERVRAALAQGFRIEFSAQLTARPPSLTLPLEGNYHLDIVRPYM